MSGTDVVRARPVGRGRHGRVTTRAACRGLCSSFHEPANEGGISQGGMRTCRASRPRNVVFILGTMGGHFTALQNGKVLVREF